MSNTESSFTTGDDEVLPIYDVEFTDEEVQMMLAANPYVLPLDFEQVLDTGEEQEYTDNKPL